MVDANVEVVSEIEIITDKSVLRQVSTPCDTDLTPENQDTMRKLVDAFPKGSLGLAAPQIGIFKRMFVVNLSSGIYFFVNPEIQWKSPDKIPSDEGCLSLPGTVRCVERHQSIKVRADVLTDGEKLIGEALQFRGLDACIVQHEYDHLEGVLLIDHPEAQTPAEKNRERNRKRQIRIKAHRSTEKILQSNKKRKVKTKKITKKAKNDMAKARHRLKKRVEVQERIRAKQEGLFESADDKS